MKLVSILLLSVLMTAAKADEILGRFQSYSRDGRSILLHSSTGQRMRVTPYGDFMVRIQAVRNTEEFFPDDRYEMVENHDWPGTLTVTEQTDDLILASASPEGVRIRIEKDPLRVEFLHKGSTMPLLKETGIEWNGSRIVARFLYDHSEHFTGLGHDYYGRAESIDIKGQRIERNYGIEHRQQAPLLVPFYLSSKGYGVFLNSTFQNSFSFGADSVYAFELDDYGFGGRMDFFFILGPEFTRILDHYTQLTGRPRLPSLAMFGLALSDKGHDHTSPTPSDEAWWRNKITEHCNAGFPLDHVVNDNRWRAGGGKRCESYFDWDNERYPDPAAYKRWLDTNGLVLTLDFNRCIGQWSEGWSPAYNIPQTDQIDFRESAPDLTREEVRSWFWKLFWTKSLNPSLHYPGEALWIDEFDEMGKAPLKMVLGNGRSWAEMKNQWFLLIAKALVQQGWDIDVGTQRRPFVWVRGMTAGAQRYATLWSGDIRPTYEEMAWQIRGMQLAGLSGFPYWGHDAGGFYDYERQQGPDEAMYVQWSMAFGSFTPYWRPHGVGKSRWPLDRSGVARKAAHTYGKLRYELMPYTYTFAHVAHATGVPMARAMVIPYHNNPLAWKYDLQYMWGDDILVAPLTADSGSAEVWLPAGLWYNYWTDESFVGDKVMPHPSSLGELPLFIRAGAILPMAPPALSTAFLRKDTLSVHVYAGADGEFRLYEDDGVSELFRKGEKRTTRFLYNDASSTLTIFAAEGSYNNAPQRRSYRITLHQRAKPATPLVKHLKRVSVLEERVVQLR